MVGGECYSFRWWLLLHAFLLLCVRHWFTATRDTHPPLLDTYYALSVLDYLLSKMQFAAGDPLLCKPLVPRWRCRQIRQPLKKVVEGDSSSSSVEGNNEGWESSMVVGRVILAGPRLIQKKKKLTIC
ncbi:hypothetical protein PIB30_058371 [Stylosanthes scabra]|uniref:Secreted protein n=1 Tax=Stylosanthes scabra TaxID=79078 RepID=A0ABU6VI56_9FABA|nr:hypothetical protein [Stylosanthes scabra]